MQKSLTEKNPGGSFAFICYSHADAASVQLELEHLRKKGINYWYDKSITPGAAWSQELADVLDKADSFLFFISPQSVKSRFCLNEVQYALSRDKAMLAIHIQPTDMPSGLELTLGASQAIFRYQLDDASYYDKLDAFIVSHRESESADNVNLFTDTQEKTFLAARFDAESLDALGAGTRKEALESFYDFCRSSDELKKGNLYKNTASTTFLAFDNPANAVLAGIELQKMMRIAGRGSGDGLKLRVAIHTGLARAKGSDFFGPVIPALEQVLEVTKPGQLVLSSKSAESISGDSPVSLNSLGEYNLTDVGATTLYQVEADGLEAIFNEREDRVERFPGNLPANLTSFLGRSRELVELHGIFKRSRLVTLMGPGGIGKTRLAIEFARTVQNQFNDGTWLVDLSVLDKGSSGWPTIAATLSLEALPGVEPRIQVLGHLRNARALLLLDNCEHLLEEIPDEVADLAVNCPNLCILSTSRQLLGIQGEALYEVPVLKDASQQDPAEQVSVKLFIERAQMVSHRFRLQPGDLSRVQEVCENLDHLPLAIEIAAGNIRRYSLEKICLKTKHPLDLAATQSRGAGRSRETLRETLAWSYDLLDQNTQEVFKRLSIFAGPFEEDLALTVCVTGDFSEQAVLNGIDELADSSFIHQESGDRQRYRMLFSIQSFGREKLAECGLLDELEVSHDEAYAAYARELGDMFDTDREAESARLIYDELPNFRTAFERAIKRDPELAGRLITPLVFFCYLHRGAEHSKWFSRLAEHPAVSTIDCAPLVFAGAASYQLHAKGDLVQAQKMIDLGLEAEAAGRGTSLGWLYNIGGQVALWSGAAPETVLGFHQQAIEQASTAGNLGCQIISQSLMPYTQTRMGDLEGAAKSAETATELARKAIQPDMIGYAHYAQAVAEANRDTQKAISEFEKSIEWTILSGNTQGERRCRAQLARVKELSSTPDEAVVMHIRLLGILPEHGETIHVWAEIRALIKPLSTLKSDQEVAILAGALENAPIKLPKSVAKAISNSKARLEKSDWDAAFARGNDLSLEEVRRHVMENIACYFQV